MTPWDTVNIDPIGPLTFTYFTRTERLLAVLTIVDPHA